MSDSPESQYESIKDYYHRALGKGLEEKEEKDRIRSRDEARGVFVAFICEDVPDVYESLAEAPYRCYRAIPARDKVVHTDHGSHRWSHWCDVPGRDIASPVETSFIDALESWAAQWHLKDPWCLDWAVLALERWGDLTWLHRKFPPGYPLVAHEGRANKPTPYFAPEELAFNFSHPGWNPRALSRAGAKREIVHAFAHDLESYLAELDELIKQRALVPRIHKRTLDHFHWLIQYQIGGIEFADIAATTKRSGIDKHQDGRTTLGVKSIEAGVKSTARLIGLSLRPGRSAGRPPSSATSGNA